MWGSEVLSHEKVGMVSGRSADRGNHGLGNRGHLGDSTGHSKERKLTLAKHINAGVIAGCAREHQ